MGTFTCMAGREGSRVEVGGPPPHAVQPVEDPLPTHRRFARVQQGRGGRLLHPDRARPAAAPGRPPCDVHPVARTGSRASRSSRRTPPRTRPDWVRTRARCPRRGPGMKRDTIDYVLVEDLPTLVWAANLAALELHVPQWRGARRRHARRTPTCSCSTSTPARPRPSSSAAGSRCCCASGSPRTAWSAYPKTSGSKGMQVYVPLEPTPAERTSGYAKTLAEDLERAEPDARGQPDGEGAAPRQGVRRLVAEQRREDDGGAVLAARAAAADGVDAADVGRGRGLPRRARTCVFTADDVLDRVEAHGDLLEPLLARPTKGRGRARSSRRPSEAGCAA